MKKKLSTYKKKTTKKVTKKVSAKKKGTQLETEIKKVARKHKCKVLSNIFIGYKTKDKKQRYIEVDVAILSEKGIIIVEAKNYSCSIQGSVNDIYVKTIYPSGKVFSIYNPIVQNNSHIKQIQNYLDVKNLKSFIVFSDNTQIEFTDIDSLNSDVKLMNFSQLDKILGSYLNRASVKYSEAQLNSLYNKLQKRVKVSPLVKLRHRNYVKKLKK